MATADLPNLGILPVGVISTEAIGMLDPVVPQAKLPPVSRRSKIGGASRSWAQIVLTAVPLVAADAAVMLCSFYGFTLLLCALTDYSPHPWFWLQGLGVLGGYLFIATLLGLIPATGMSPILELRQSVIAGVSAFGLMMLTNLAAAELSRLEVYVGLLGAGCVAIALPIARASVRHVVRHYSWWGERAVIIGGGVQGQAIYSFYLRAASRGLRPIGIVDRWDNAKPLVPALDEDRYRYLGSINRLTKISRRHSIRWGIIAPGGCEGLEMTQLMQFGSELPNLIVLPSRMMIPSLWTNPRECAGVIGLHVRDHLRNPFNALLKRSLDIVGAVVGLILAIPLLLVVAIVTKRNSPGPLFYGHRRVGRDGVYFNAWKFRTMVVNADQVLEQHLERDPELRRQWYEDQKLRNDPRIVPGIGNLLRKTSLDEIPQLWNVLLGQMSLVGPRPIVTAEIEKYQELFPFYLRVRPGITGLWQVSGRNDTSYDQRVRLDSFYVCNWSIWFDIYLILRTVRTVLHREGAY